MGKRKNRRNNIRGQLILGISLVMLSAVLYYIHYLVFHDAHHIFIYLLGDIAFVPVEVLLVTLIIHRLLSMREKKALLEKMNMIIGAFFSETGTELLKLFSDADPGMRSCRLELKIDQSWDENRFDKVERELRIYGYDIDPGMMNLMVLRDFLVDKRDFMIRLLENPNLLEHEDFTDLLWAVFHLTEEISGRDDLAALPGSDQDHLKGDMKRVYVLLVHSWLDYMLHLKKNYPYLFSLAVRKNPFDKEASIVVK